MIRDYINRLWDSWWTRIALPSSILSLLAKVDPDYEKRWFHPYIGPVLLTGMVILFVYAPFQVFAEVKRELDGKNTDAQSRLPLLLSEISFNVDNHNHSVMLLDETYRAYEKAPDAPLPSEAREAMHRHYNSVRALKAMEVGSGPRESEMNRRKQLRESVWSDGQKAIAGLRAVANGKNR